jgi:hypothetical protein
MCMNLNTCFSSLTNLLCVVDYEVVANGKPCASADKMMTTTILLLDVLIVYQ